MDCNLCNIYAKPNYYINDFPLPCRQMQNQQWCQPCGFPAKLGLFFCGVAGFYEGLRVACFWACCKWNLLVFWACFFPDFCFVDCFFSNFTALLLFQFTAKGILGVLLWKFPHFGLVFSDLPPCFFCLIFLLILSFCWIFMPTDVGLVFRLDYLFLACFSNLLACFCKITWHHWKSVFSSNQSPTCA